MGYREIPFAKFLIALFILAIPPMVMSEMGMEKWVYAYVFLILLSFAVYQYGGIEKFSKFLGTVK